MRRFRKFPFVFLLFILLSPAFAQQKSNYSLLWKISGKGMSKPSYLFGTMHVKDKRVFNFSDSVMLALQNCKQFSLEVHPDTLMAKMFATLQNQDSLRSIDKLLGKEDYEKLAKKFKDKNGYEMDKTDPMLLESLMKPSENKPGDKVSFVDAYLYGIARTLNKNILGLEDAASQFDQYYGSKEAIKERLLDLLDDDATSAEKDGTEEMIKIYSTGNIDKVYQYIIDRGADHDSTIIARNKVMASSMIKYMANGPLFTAVGAAHLPGDDGVIALLRKEGYTVRRAGASFTGVAGKYHIDYMKMDWPVYKDENQGFAVNFPGTPIHFKMSGVNTIIYPDMANEVYYGIYAVPRGLIGAPPNRAQVINRFITGIKNDKKNRLIGRRDFIFNKMPCTEITLKTGPGYSRVRLLVENNTLFGFYAGARLNKLGLPYINRYLNSFKIVPVVPKAPESWITYNNPMGAFTAKLPGQPQVLVQAVPATINGKEKKFTINLYVSTDSANSKSYVIRYNDYPPGTFLSKSELLFDGLKKQFEGKGTIIGEPVKINLDGYEGREMTVILKGGFYSKIRMFARGNRIYILLKEITQPDVKDDSKDTFFDSFKLTPYTEPQYYTFRPDSGNYELQMVAKPELVPDSARDKTYNNFEKNIHTWYSTNPGSGGLFGFEHSTLSPYFRIKNIDSLYQKMIAAAVGYQDSVLKVDTITLDGVKGRDLLTQRKGSGAKRRTRILIKGDDIFYFIGHTDNSELYEKSTETFYNSLKIKQTTSKNDLSASKAEMLFRDLGSSDSTEFNNAKGALSYYNFTSDELPFIYSALQKKYPDDTSTYSAREKLIRGFRTLHNDSTASFLAKLYHQLKDKDDLKATILFTIPLIDSSNGYNTYLDLLTAADAPVKASNSYSVFRPLTDSLQFAAVHFDKILPFIKNEKYRPDILRIANSLIELKNAEYTKLVNDNYEALMAYAKSDIDSYLALPDSARSSTTLAMYYYMQLMSKTTGHELTDKLTKNYLEKEPDGIYAPEAAIARINNKLPDNQLLINKFLDSLGTRYGVMEAFSKQNQLSRVPLKYRQQAEFAKLNLFEVLSQDDDYGTPDKITLLGSINNNGSVYYAFKFSLKDEEDDKKKDLIGLAGPYRPGSAKLDFKRYSGYTEYEPLKINWRAQATKLIKPLLANYSDN